MRPISGNYSIGRAVRSQSNVSLESGWNLFGITLENNDSGTDRNISVANGFNLIAYSSDNEILQSSIEYINSTGTRASWSNAVSNNRVRNQFSYYNASSGARKFQYTPLHDTRLRKNRGYWVYVNDSLGRNISLPSVGGSFLNESYAWRDLMFRNASGSELNVTDARAQGMVGVSNTDPDLIQYWDPNDITYVTLGSTETLVPWRGYFIWSRQDNVTLLRQN